MLRQEIEEELLNLLDSIKEERVIVEGKRDKKALCLLGFKNVLTINKGIYETAEKIRENRIIILTDYDSEGRKIAKKLNLVLQSLGHSVDKETRRKIGLLFTRLEIRKIEELRGVLNEQTSSINFKVYNLC
jgi:5S rRNA maturation endonuclease (ribonuclease M5)